MDQVHKNSSTVYNAQKPEFFTVTLNKLHVQWLVQVVCLCHYSQQTCVPKMCDFSSTDIKSTYPAALTCPPVPAIISPLFSQADLFKSPDIRVCIRLYYIFVIPV